MLACVVDCSRVRRARSTCKTTGCERKLEPAEQNSHDDKHVTLTRPFSSSAGYSEGACHVRSNSPHCPDGACEQSEDITAKGDGPDSGDEAVDNAPARKEHCCDGDEVDERNCGQICEPGHDRLQSEVAEGAVPCSKKDLPLFEEKSNNSRSTEVGLAGRMPATAIDRHQISSAVAQLECVEDARRKFSGTRVEVVRGEARLNIARLGEGAVSPEVSRNSIEREKEPQVPATGRGSHELLREKLDVLESSGQKKGGVELGLSSGWGSDLKSCQEHSSFHAEETVECITNVGEDEDFGLDLDQFRTPSHVQKCHDETKRLERRSESYTRGKQFQGDHDREGREAFETREAQTDKAVAARTGPWQPSSKSEPVEIHPRIETTCGERRILQRSEAGPGTGDHDKARDLEGKLTSRKGDAIPGADERRVRARVDSPITVKRREEQTETAAKALRPTRPSAGKDRHSKVNTAKGPRDRRVRLSVPTALQFYDVQDRLGYDQPSKAVEWLIKKAKAAIDELGRLPPRPSDSPSALSDTLRQTSSYPSDLSGIVGGSSSSRGTACSFPSAALSSTYGDIVGNHINYFLDSSGQSGLAFGNNQGNIRDVVGGAGFSQSLIGANHGQLARLNNSTGHQDLARANSGFADGSKLAELCGSPLARVESRVKARERARERVKERCMGKEGGRGKDGCSSPSMQSPPLPPDQSHNSFSVQDSMQPQGLGSIHIMSHGPQDYPYPRVINSSLAELMLSCPQGPPPGMLHNMLVQNPSIPSLFSDQLQDAPQHTRHSSFQNLKAQQHAHSAMSSLEGAAEGGLDLGSGFNAGPCPSPFSEGVPLTSSDFLSSSPLRISQALSMPHMPAPFGMSSSCSLATHFDTVSSAPQMPSGYSHEGPAPAFSSRSSTIRLSAPLDQQQRFEGLSRSQSQIVLPSFNCGSPSSRATSPIGYTPPTRMGSLQSISPTRSLSNSFSPIRTVSFDYDGGVPMMSPGNHSTSYPAQSSQLQMPLRIGMDGLQHDDFVEDLKSPATSSPHVHR